MRARCLPLHFEMRVVSKLTLNSSLVGEHPRFPTCAPRALSQGNEVSRDQSLARAHAYKSLVAPHIVLNALWPARLPSLFRSGRCCCCRCVWWCLRYCCREESSLRTRFRTHRWLRFACADGSRVVLCGPLGSLSSLPGSFFLGLLDASCAMRIPFVGRFLRPSLPR